MSDFSQTAAPAPGDTIAVITTNQGVMKARIFVDVVPAAAQNFVDLVNQEKYNNVGFHRVIPDFMIQGGDFTRGDGTGGHAAKGPNSTIGDQYDPKLKHSRGALSWAKTQAPNSIGSQFFIVHAEKGTPFLDHKTGSGPADGYTVFGQLFEGFEVLDKIGSAKTDGRDRPVSPMTIESITIETIPV